MMKRGRKIVMTMILCWCHLVSPPYRWGLVRYIWGWVRPLEPQLYRLKIPTSPKHNKSKTVFWLLHFRLIAIGKGNTHLSQQRWADNCSSVWSFQSCWQRKKVWSISTYEAVVEMAKLPGIEAVWHCVEKSVALQTMDRNSWLTMDLCNIEDKVWLFEVIGVILWILVTTNGAF